MKQRKSKLELKPRIVARVDPKFHEQVSRFAEALEVSVQELVVQSLVTEMQGFDLRVQLQKLQNQFKVLQETKSAIRAERNLMRQALKDIASKLGVPDTAGHCIQRIREIESELQMTVEKLSVVEGDRDVIKTERDDYKASRDAFKAKSEACESDLRVVKAKLAAYEGQGLIGRVLGRAPVVEPFAEPQE